MKYKTTLVVVKDIEKSKRFYHDVLGLRVIADFGANVTLTGGLSLQTEESWCGFIGKKSEEIIYSNNACELYFEEDDISGFCEKLKSYSFINYVHKLKEHSWGQRAVRFYDPDKHIIEVGESLDMVIKRFAGQGITAGQIAERMDISVKLVERSIKKI